MDTVREQPVHTGMQGVGDLYEGGRLILVDATSVWEICWLVSPTISANCSCDNPADMRAARIFCPNNT